MRTKICLSFLFIILSAFFSGAYSQLSSQGNIHVNGGGTAIEGGARSTFVFNAVKNQSGIIGHLVYHLRVFDVRFHMDLDCLEISGNRATMSGTVTTVSGPNIPSYIFPGSRASFTVEDNGNGGNKDWISDVVFGANCTDDLDTYIRVQGNISIKN